MNLVEALRINSDSRIAFTGAGGKTSAIFAIARQWGKRIIVTTTTHLATHQAELADQHFIMKDYSWDSLNLLIEVLPEGITLITGPIGGDDRLAGITNGPLDGIELLAQKFKTPLLIEADGANQRMVKAPAEHEPAFPDIAFDGVNVVNLDAVGKRLDEESVHRPEQFAALADISMGSIITTEAVVKVMLAKNGGLKNLPEYSRPIALLINVDNNEKKALAQSIAKQLVPSYHAVVSADIPHYSTGLDSKVMAVKEPVAAIILAAGESKRLGKPKQLLDWKGETFIRHIISEAIDAKVDKIIVVTGAYKEEVEAEISGLPIELVHNPNWEDGQSGSIKIGLLALPEYIGAAIFLLVDQPQVSSTLLRKLTEMHSSTLAAIIGPEVDGQRGNPVLFDRRTFANFHNLSGDIGGRALFSKFKVCWIPWLDQNMSLDVDTDEDYQKLLEQE